MSVHTLNLKCANVNWCVSLHAPSILSVPMWLLRVSYRQEMLKIVDARRKHGEGRRRRWNTTRRSRNFLAFITSQLRTAGDTNTDPYNCTPLCDLCSSDKSTCCTSNVQITLKTLEPTIVSLQTFLYCVTLISILCNFECIHYVMRGWLMSMYCTL